MRFIMVPINNSINAIQKWINEIKAIDENVKKTDAFADKQKAKEDLMCYYLLEIQRSINSCNIEIKKINDFIENIKK